MLLSTLLFLGKEVVNSNSFVANLGGWVGLLFLLLFGFAWVLYTPLGLGFLVPFQ